MCAIPSADSPRRKRPPPATTMPWCACTEPVRTSILLHEGHPRAWTPGPSGRQNGSPISHEPWETGTFAKESVGIEPTILRCARGLAFNDSGATRCRIVQAGTRTRTWARWMRTRPHYRWYGSLIFAPISSTGFSPKTLSPGPVGFPAPPV